jgi:hypothetical protein
MPCKGLFRPKENSCLLCQRPKSDHQTAHRQQTEPTCWCPRFGHSPTCKFYEPEPAYIFGDPDLGEY